MTTDNHHVTETKLDNGLVKVSLTNQNWYIVSEAGVVGIQSCRFFKDEESAMNFAVGFTAHLNGDVMTQEMIDTDAGLDFESALEVS